jgi:hypothetical protein
VDSIAIALARSDVGQVGVPGKGILFLQPNSSLNARIIEQAQFYFLRNFGEDGEVRAGTVV